MGIALRIAVLYATPVIAVVLALVCFVVLWRRVRRGALPRGLAARRFAWLLLLPLAVVLVVAGTGEVASYLAVGDQYAFDPGAMLHLLWSLRSLALYVMAPIVVLLVILLLTRERPPGTK